jgi:hypothetical protein
MNSLRAFSTFGLTAGHPGPAELANSCRKRPSLAAAIAGLTGSERRDSAAWVQFSRPLRLGLPFGSIKEDVKRKSSPASWKQRKVSASSPVPLLQVLEA